MRKVTLCTVVIAGAVLTSLPFRRPVVDPTVPPGFSPVVTSTGLATGPTQSPFALSPHELIGPIETRSAAIPASSRFESDQSRGMWSSAIPSDQPVRQRRAVDLPLTFEDLAVPLTTPHYRDGRFNALATSGEPAPDKSSSADENFMAVQVQREANEGLVAPQLTEPASQPAVSGRLASTEAKPVSDAPAIQVSDGQSSANEVLVRPSPSPQAEQLPARVRHWIRQPD